MSRPRIIEMKCPHCGSVEKIQIWESANVSLDPSFKEKILNGDLFKFRCSKCGQIYTVNYGFIYHDMDKKLMIVVSDNIEHSTDLINEFMNAGKSFGADASDYTYRIVNNRNELVEKIMIFDVGANDRVVEYFKYLHLQKLRQEHPEINDPLAFFNVYDGNDLSLDFYDDHFKMIDQVPLKLQMISKQFENVKKDEFVINQEWAAKSLLSKE